MSDIARVLGKALLTPPISVTVYTVGGIDDNGNDIEEPTVFYGSYIEAVSFFDDEENIRYVDHVLQNMPDGYVLVEVGNYDRQIYDANEIMKTIEEMV